MMDSVDPASPPDATESKRQSVLDLFAQFAADNPEALAYLLQSEAEARAILVELVPALRVSCASISDRPFRMEVLTETNRMQQAIDRQRCWTYISKRVGVNAISLSGIRIVARKDAL